jgi:hypothetical protein
VGLPTPVTADLLLRGLLVGQPFAVGGLVGAWGLWGSHDFLTLPEARVTSGALGVGGVLEHAFGEGRRLRATGVLSGIVLGGAGALHQTDELRREKALGPGYGVGPGVQALLDVELLWRQEAALRLTGRSWRIHPLTGGRPWEEVEALGVGGRLRVGGPHMLGVGLDVGRRAAGPQARQAGVTASLFWWVPLGQAR